MSRCEHSVLFCYVRSVIGEVGPGKSLVCHGGINMRLNMKTVLPWVTLNRGSHKCAIAHRYYTPPGTQDPNKYAWAFENPSFAGLPPASITVAELDTLRDSAIQVACRMMAESGNGCELHVWRGAYHGSVALGPSAIASQAQDATIASFFQRHLCASQL